MLKPPALMHAITEVTESKLYNRALEPFLLGLGVLDPEGERVIEAAWMMSEAPRKKRVMVMITSRALYLLETPRLLGVSSR